MSTAVYRHYSQQELDAQYNNRARFPDFSEQFNRWTEWSMEARARLPARLDVAFGDSAKQRLDLFPAESADAPLYVFIHGGYWYSLDKEHYSFVAQGMRPHGVTTAITNYALAPDADMDTIVEDNRKALAWLWSNAAQCGASRDRIYVCGHSAGGHLALMLLATDWSKYGIGMPRDAVKGVCAIGGIFDLEPIRLSYLNKTLKLEKAQASRNSPTRQAYPQRAPLSLILAIDESDEYHRQSREMHALWASLGYPAELFIPQDLNHFSVVNDLGNPACELVTHQLEQMILAFGSSGQSSQFGAARS